MLTMSLFQAFRGVQGRGFGRRQRFNILEYILHKRLDRRVSQSSLHPCSSLFFPSKTFHSPIHSLTAPRVECPPGTPEPYTCGLSAIPHFVTISGTYSEYYASGNCGSHNGQTVAGSTQPFSYQAPVTDTGTVAPDGGHHNLFTFAACICTLSANQTTGPGLAACPAPSC